MNIPFAVERINPTSGEIEEIEFEVSYRILKGAPGSRDERGQQETPDEPSRVEITTVDCEGIVLTPEEEEQVREKIARQNSRSELECLGPFFW